MHPYDAIAVAAALATELALDPPAAKAPAIADAAALLASPPVAADWAIAWAPVHQRKVSRAHVRIRFKGEAQNGCQEAQTSVKNFKGEAQK